MICSKICPSAPFVQKAESSNRGWVGAFTWFIYRKLVKVCRRGATFSVCHPGGNLPPGGGGTDNSLQQQPSFQLPPSDVSRHQTFLLVASKFTNSKAASDLYISVFSWADFKLYKPRQAEPFFFRCPFPRFPFPQVPTKKKSTTRRRSDSPVASCCSMFCCDISYFLNIKHSCSRNLMAIN